MADSNITKKALAKALQELMEEMPFEKINVAQICERCDMNRKSFYYHFQDKYDLVNWIFDTDFISFALTECHHLSYEDRWKSIEEVCNYFYENRSFYRKALQIKGQNSFPEHFREYIQPLLRERLTDLYESEVDDFSINFYADAVLCAIERWLLDKDCMTASEFMFRLERVVRTGAKAFIDISKIK